MSTVEERWAIVEPHVEGGTLVDLGCYDGAFCRLAAARGMSATGVEDRTDVPGVYHQIIYSDMLDLPAEYIDADTILLLRVWPYLLLRHGEVKALAFLRRVIKGCRVLFFETQLWGDGPGPENLKTPDDVQVLLESCGGQYVRMLADLPVEGRDAYRAVFLVAGGAR